MQIWARSANGIIAGVCNGLAQRFRVNVTLVRIAWTLSVLLAGIGIGVYLILALSLPRDDRLDQAYESRILGVASRFARRFDLDVGLTRAGFLFLLFGTGGLMVLAYVIMYFVLSHD